MNRCMLLVDHLSTTANLLPHGILGHRFTEVLVTIYVYIVKWLRTKLTVYTPSQQILILSAAITCIFILSQTLLQTT